MEFDTKKINSQSSFSSTKSQTKLVNKRLRFQVSGGGKGSKEKKLNFSDLSLASELKEEKQDNNKCFNFLSLVQKAKNIPLRDLTQLQEDIIYAIETLNKSLFIDLGGLSSINMNFKINGNLDFPLGVAWNKSSTEIASLILENPTVDPHQINKDGANSFWMAWQGGKDEILPILIKKDINYLIKTGNGINSLHIAVINNHLNVVSYLTDINFPLNIRVSWGPTAICIAAEMGHLEIVKLLVGSGANINKLSENGYGALYWSIQNKNTQIAKFLVEKGAKMVLSK